MRILIVNPNTTASMTEKIAIAARAVARPDSEILAVNPSDGPVSIEGYYDEAFSVPGLLQEIAKGEAAGVDGHVIACFDDTGLEAARCLAAAPVVGICEAACHMASLLATSFSVVTTLGRAVPALEQNIRKYGFERQCQRVRAADLPVLALEDPASDARRLIENEIAAALAEDNAEAIVLGCAGMADLAATLSRQFEVPVLEGVAAGVALIESLHSLGLRTSKRRGYATPLPKTYRGDLARFAPGGPARSD